jgi:AcrR family transcriptional regulator
MPATTRSGTGRRPRTPNFDAREHLLDAAISLFAERGIADTTVAQIASADNVTSAMVHYWFQTRDRLLDAVVDERLAPLFLQIWGPADLTGGAPLDLVEGIVRRMLDVTEQHPWLPSLWLREIVNEGGQLRERALRHIPLKQIAAFGHIIAGGQQRGEVNADIEPLLVFNSILAIVMLPQASAKIWRRIHPAVSLERATLERHVIGLLMHGMAGNIAVETPNRRSRRRAS